MVDHQDLDRALSPFQLEPELLLHRREDGESIRVVVACGFPLPSSIRPTCWSQERGTALVMVDGRATRVSSVDRATAERITKQYGAKYGRVYDYHPKPEQWEGGGYVLTPAKVFSWDVRGFPRTVTRYRF